MSNQQKCACDYVVDLTAQLDNAKLNQVFKKSLELLIVDTEFKWELPSLKDIRESNHSAVNIRHKSDSAKIEIFLGNQVIANCSINKVLSVKEKTQLNMLANVFKNAMLA